MLTTNRRLRTIFIALAGMDAAVSAVGLLLLFRLRLLWLEDTPPAVEPFQLVLGVWVALLALILAVDLLTRSRLSDRSYRLALLALVLATGLVLARGLSGATGIFDFGWLAETTVATVNFQRGLHPGTFGLILAFYLWWRASVLADRDIAFWGIGLSFRIGLLLLIGGAGWLALRNRDLIDTSIWLLALYLALGLTAVALARSDEKASGAPGSAGSSLSFGRLTQLLLVVFVIVGLSVWIGVGYSPADMRATLALLDPLWGVFRFVGQYVFIGLVFVLEIVVGWLFALIAPLLAEIDLADALAGLAGQFPAEQQTEALQEGDPWPYAALLLSALRVTVVIVAVVIGLLLLYIFFVRRQRHAANEENEITEAASAQLNANALRRGLDRLRRWADLVRQYGLGAQLLDAITVENIYANLVRLARQRGHPRRAAQPPDEYLPALILAFPGHDSALERITNAYMRVHYGDHPVSGDELRVLREDYDHLRQEKPTGR